MITSRNILFATVLVSLGLVSALPIAVNVKYKRRSFVSDRNQYDYYKLNPARYVSVTHLNNLVIVPSDSFRLEVASELKNAITIANTGDTLSLLQKGSNTHHDSAQVILYLPKVDRIISLASIIKLKGGMDLHPPTPSFKVDLHGSHLYIPTFIYHQFFDQLSITGSDSSSLTIGEHNHIWELNLQNLEHTVVEASVELRKVKTTFDRKAVVNMS
ncbi:MAG TPA: hypothetical protein VK666_13410, partial [Chryseolinea sp.]|nr:hypothetical protein [Chryseolinea sp.]